MFPFSGGSPNYQERASRALLPHSCAGTLQHALEEWYFTGECVDYGLPNETCDLCSYQELRYHFTIKNVNTDHELLVGSECIQKFNISVIDARGRILPDDKAHNYLESKRKRARVTLLLEKLCNKEPNSYNCSARSYFRNRGYLTPKLANIVFWRLDYYNIEHNTADCTVEIYNEKTLQDFLGLRDFQKDRIRPALSEEAQYILKTGDVPMEDGYY